MPSMAQKTPIMRPLRIRNAPMYWFTRLVIDSHEAMITTTLMNAVSSTNHREMPSTPKW